MSEPTLALQKMLRLVKLFEGFSEQDARDFLGIAKRFDASAGETVIREGDNEADAYIVAAGRLNVVKSCAGASDTLATLEAGDTFGEVSLLDSGPRSASVVAASPATLLRFGRSSLAKIPHVSTKVMRNVAKMMAGRLRATSTQATLARVTLARLTAEPEPVQPAPQVRTQRH